MTFYLIIAGITLAAIASLLFSSLTYALRDFSRSRLAGLFERRGKQRLLEAINDHSNDLIFVTALMRMIANLLILIGTLSLFQHRDPGHEHGINLWFEYLLAVLASAVITLFSSIALPHAIAKYAGEGVIVSFAGSLLMLRVAFVPVTKIMHAIDGLIRRISGASLKSEQEDIENEIMSVVEEGEKEGVVDEEEREMIESVIDFRDTQVGQIMTARPEIVGIEQGASLREIKGIIARSGHSRMPVYEGTLDHIVGILYARDLLKHLGLLPEKFDIRSAMRPAFYVPETKLLRDLLNDFRLQKVHIAIVLDEYGGTAGLVTIEDLLEELVGDISDEHEPAEPAMLNRLDDHTYDADARMYIDEVNRTTGLDLPDDAGYDTLGGFVSTTLGRIPEAGTTFEHLGARFTILDAEPQKVNRVKIEFLLQTVESDSPPGK